MKPAHNQMQEETQGLLTRAAPLLGVLLAVQMGSAGAATVTSAFDVDDEGWLVVGDSTSAAPDYLPSGGNAGGAIEATDRVAGGVWYFGAPAKFLGDKSLALGQSLAFDLYQTGSGAQFSASDVVLTGAGLTLTFDAPDNPLPLGSWISYSVDLTAAAGWQRVSSRTSVSGTQASEAELASVLGDLDSLLIRGEYISGSDQGRLDNVTLSAVPLPAAVWSFAAGMGILGGIARRHGARRPLRP